jgi:pimeloyl-ACP methyl ester carboxylesterase
MVVLLKKMIFIHGLEGTSQGVKASLLRGIYPHILTPDFQGGLSDRMEKLNKILADENDWTIIGSSFGGLMAALFACRHPQLVRKAILLAPALLLFQESDYPKQPVDVPVTIYHGVFDMVIPLQAARLVAQQIFSNLVFHEVDDDHGLYKTVHKIDWRLLLMTD